ncbi:MAG: hypothetical protein V1836_04610 [Candidatus Aenigmatarchaeota archaeon]
MTEKLFVSRERGWVFPHFAKFCQQLWDTRADKISVHEDGSGIYVSAGPFSVDLRYEKGSVYSLQTKIYLSPDTMEEHVYSLKERENDWKEYAREGTGFDMSSVRISSLAEIGAQLSKYEGGVIHECVLQPIAYSQIINTERVHANLDPLPDNMQFFFPENVLVSFMGGQVGNCLYADEDGFREAECAMTGNGKTLYTELFR